MLRTVSGTGDRSREKRFRERKKIRMTNRQQRALPVDPEGPGGRSFARQGINESSNGPPILPSAQRRLLVPVGSYMRKTLAIGR